MKKLLFLIVVILGIKVAFVIASLVRGAMLRTLSEQLAHFIVENDYRLPHNWVEYECYYFGKKGIRYQPSANSSSSLDKRFILPWGESVTNQVVLTNKCWFKSIDRENVKEDMGMTHLTMSYVRQFSTNHVILSQD